LLAEPLGTRIDYSDRNAKYSSIRLKSIQSIVTFSLRFSPQPSQPRASMKQWYSAFELSGLPGLPALPNNITRKAKAEKWQSRQRTGRGGGREYAYNSLPKTTQKALIHSPDRKVDVNIEPSIGSPKVRSQVQQVKPTSEQSRSRNHLGTWWQPRSSSRHWQN
jgi:hypothetical protein